jgi:hypothetical protein
MSNDSNEPKIVVDDDWKERVRAEREAERAARQAQERAADDSAHARAASSGRPPEPDSFAMLVSMLATQTMVALGKIPDPLQGHAVVRPDHAKQAIGMLTMLEQKTKGNLSAEEQQMLDHLLHELRLLYLAVYKTPQETPPDAADQEPDASHAEA